MRFAFMTFALIFQTAFAASSQDVPNTFCSTMQVAEIFKILPEPILNVYSPRLSYLVRRFDHLTFDFQCAALTEYLAAVKYFKESAYKIVHDKAFLDEHGRRFAFADVDKLKE